MTPLMRLPNRTFLSPGSQSILHSLNKVIFTLTHASDLFTITRAQDEVDQEYLSKKCQLLEAELFKKNCIIESFEKKFTDLERQFQEIAKSQANVERVDSSSSCQISRYTVNEPSFSVPMKFNDKPTADRLNEIEKVIANLAGIVNDLQKRQPTSPTLQISQPVTSHLTSSGRATETSHTVPLSWSQVVQSSNHTEAEQKRQTTFQAKVALVHPSRRSDMEFVLSRTKFGKQITEEVPLREKPRFLDLDQSPSPAVFAAEDAHNVRIVHVRGFLFDTYANIRMLFRRARIHTSRIVNMRWMGQSILEVVVEADYQRLFQSQIKDIDPTFIAKVDSAGRSIVNPERKKQISEIFHRSVLRSIERTNHGRVRNFFSDLLTELDFDIPETLAVPKKDFMTQDDSHVIDAQQPIIHPDVEMITAPTAQPTTPDTTSKNKSAILTTHDLDKELMDSVDKDNASISDATSSTQKAGEGMFMKITRNDTDTDMATKRVRLSSRTPSPTKLPDIIPDKSDWNAVDTDSDDDINHDMETTEHPADAASTLTESSL